MPSLSVHSCGSVQRFPLSELRITMRLFMLFFCNGPAVVPNPNPARATRLSKRFHVSRFTANGFRMYHNLPTRDFSCLVLICVLHGRQPARSVLGGKRGGGPRNPHGPQQQHQQHQQHRPACRRPMWFPWRPGPRPPHLTAERPTLLTPVRRRNCQLHTITWIAIFLSAMMCNE